MPKIISNLNEDSNKFPSLVCNFTSQGQLASDQLYCCCGDNCNSNFNLSSCDSSCMISQCRSINALDACQKRTDSNAQQVCNWKADYFCLSNPSTDASHKEQFEAIKWSINRNKFEESEETTACYDGTSFLLNVDGKWCELGSVTCGDLFSSSYTCNWKSNDGESIDRHPLGEVCERIIPATSTTDPTTDTTTITNTATSIKTNSSDNGKGVKIGLGVGLPIFLIAIGAFCWVWKIKRSQKP